MIVIDVPNEGYCKEKGAQRQKLSGNANIAYQKSIFYGDNFHWLKDKNYDIECDFETSKTENLK